MADEEEESNVPEENIEAPLVPETFTADQQISSEGNFENFSDALPDEKIPPNIDGNSTIEIEDEVVDDSKKLFVGGLSWETTENDLKEYFSKYGAVKTCTIKVDKFTGHSRGFGFVIFEDEAFVDKVLEQKDHKLCNKKIDPKRAKPSREPQKKIFVGGIDPDVSEEQIKEYFGQYGKIEALDLPFDNQRGKRKSYIFVCYTTEAEAKKATEREKQDIFGKKCDVRIAVPREQAGKQRSGWGHWGGYGGGYGGYPAYDNYGYGYGPGYGYGQYGGYDYGYGYGSYDYGYTGYDYSGYSYGGGYGGATNGAGRESGEAPEGDAGVPPSAVPTGPPVSAGGPGPGANSGSVGGKMRGGRGGSAGGAAAASHPYRQ